MKAIMRWTVFSVPLAAITGSMVALFLWLLDQVTAIRWANAWLLYLLPLIGVLVWFLYKRAGKKIEQGNTLLLAEITEPSSGVPGRMAPMVLAGTLLTHLGGGSAGREGTAVQMGGSIAALLGRWFRVDKEDLKALLTCGIAAGFAAVFGTPFAAVIFALEVLPALKSRWPGFAAPALSSFRYFIPCLAAALLADLCCSAYGIHHTVYSVAVPDLGSYPFASIHLNWLLLGKAALMGIFAGLAAMVFTHLSHAIRSTNRLFHRTPWLFPFAGGCLVIAGTLALGTPDYLGLGVTSPDPGAVSILSTFKGGGAETFSWLWKLLFTAVTIGTGFKGGEVTPLFFIGAALGNTVAGMTGAPVDLMAALGFIAVFAGATNTPFACIIMGVELFGGQEVLYYAVACLLAWFCSGPKGIYDPGKINKPLEETILPI